MFALRLEKFPQSRVQCREDLWRRIADELLREGTSIFMQLPCVKSKTVFPWEKVNALNFSSTALFTGRRGVNRIKFINFHASIILELNRGAARRRSLNLSSAPREMLPFPVRVHCLRINESIELVSR